MDFEYFFSLAQGVTNSENRKVKQKRVSISETNRQIFKQFIIYSLA